MSDNPYLGAEALREKEGQNVTLKITTSMRTIKGEMLIDLGDGSKPKAAPVTMTQPEEIDGKLEKVDEHFVDLRLTMPAGSAVERIPIRAICGLRTVSNLSVAPANALHS